MNYKLIGRYFAAMLAIEAIFMVPAAAISLGYHEPGPAKAFGICILLIAATAAALYFPTRNAKKKFYAREGMVFTGLAWIIMSVFGCLPFVMTKTIPHFTDALFEIVSGFTTTGATILTDVEHIPHGLLYWRSFSHWLGGMGVLVFMMAFFSNKGKDTGYTIHILRAESPGPEVEKLVPHMRNSSMRLYQIYLGLTILDIIFLMLGGMSAFEAVCHAFGTAGTGGFGVRNDSFASYSPYLQNVTTVFMLLFGVNFNIYFLLLLRRFRPVFKDSELKAYLGVVLASIVMICANVYPMFGTTREAVRHTAFQVASIMTTTGYATVDFNLWPSFSKTILLTLMIIGACAGSTGGGIKVARFMILWKSLRRHIRKIIYPQKVQTIRVSGQAVPEETAQGVSLYFVIYAFLLVGSVLLVSLDGFSIETNLSAVLACFNNIGPGLDVVGPTGNYAGFSILSKTILTIDMLAGRLELFPILCLVQRTTWRRR